jgi:hypothetical protein
MTFKLQIGEQKVYYFITKTNSEESEREKEGVEFAIVSLNKALIRCSGDSF